jgi:ribonucleoside-diphosphate reductase alpha chain
MSYAYDFDQRGHLVLPQAPPPSAERTAALLELRPVQPAPRAHPAPLSAPLAAPPRLADLRLDRSRDNLLTAFGKLTLTDRYLLPGETFQDLFARVSCAFADADSDEGGHVFRLKADSDSDRLRTPFR